MKQDGEKLGLPSCVFLGIYEKPSSDILALFDGNILITNLFLVYIVYWKGTDWPEGPRLSEPVTSQLIPVFTHTPFLSKKKKKPLRKTNTPCWENFSIENHTLYSKVVSHVNVQFSISKCRNKFAFFNVSWVDSENGVPV